MYHPDPRSLDILGDIASQLTTATAISNGFVSHPRFLARLATGELYFDTELELDTDGWPDGNGEGDPSWQPETSLRYSSDSSLDANRVPYFVLPLPKEWPAQFGISLGDYAAVIFNDLITFAVFGDRGPPRKLGEGSIELLHRLGKERLRPNGTVLNAGMGPGVITVVFPGSGMAAHRQSEAELLAAIEQSGRDRFVSIGGAVPLSRTA